MDEASWSCSSATSRTFPTKTWRPGGPSWAGRVAAAPTITRQLNGDSRHGSTRNWPAPSQLRSCSSPARRASGHSELLSATRSAEVRCAEGTEGAQPGTGDWAVGRSLSVHPDEGSAEPFGAESGVTGSCAPAPIASAAERHMEARAIVAGTRDYGAVGSTSSAGSARDGVSRALRLFRGFTSARGPAFHDSAGRDSCRHIGMVRSVGPVLRRRVRVDDACGFAVSSGGGRRARCWVVYRRVLERREVWSAVLRTTCPEGTSATDEPAILPATSAGHLSCTVTAGWPGWLVRWPSSCVSRRPVGCCWRWRRRWRWCGRTRRGAPATRRCGRHRSTSRSGRSISPRTSTASSTTG